jgi:DNA modification methylase
MGRACLVGAGGQGEGGVSVEILGGDCRDVLRGMADQSVHCVVTSPPYFGLRDYGVEGQMGLEETPDAFVAGMVEVFREVRRVLRDDGTLWLNLGDSYNNRTKVRTSSHQPALNGFTDDNWRERAARGGVRMSNRYEGIKEKDLIGIPWRVAFALQQPWTDWQIKSEAMRAWTAGIVDGEGCVTILRTKSSHSDSYSFPPVVQVRMTDREPLDRLVEVVGSSLGAAQHPPSQVAARQRPSWQWKVVSNQAAKVIAEIYPYLTCKRKQAVVAWNHQQFRAERGNQVRKHGEIEREEFCKALINDLNQRKPVDLPSWMIEPKIIQEAGWYLRQDLIWHKPNPMPESVTDRCTKAHEYIFLLSKSQRYYYDAEAIAEPAGWDPANTKMPDGWDTGAGGHGAFHRSDREKGRRRAAGNKTHKGTTAFLSGDEMHRTKAGLIGFAEREREKVSAGDTEATRNRRSVWTVPTQPFKDAHFATFPPDLIEPCILAGCPKGGVVLDPFGGAGTTGLVADRLQRNAVLIELNPDYAAMARRRILGDAPLLAAL